MQPLNLENDATWKRRFRTPTIAWSRIAGRNPARGLVCSNRDGVYQLHAWDVPTGDMRQVTFKPAGVIFGGISPDGSTIYYHDDEQGNEIGHYVRFPFESDANSAEDISPDMPSYASFSISQSLDGSTLGFLAAGPGGFEMYTMPVSDDGSIGERRPLYTSPALSFGPLLSFDGDYAVIATTERSHSTDRALMAFAISHDAPGEPLILEDADGSITPVSFAPVSGDARLLATTDVSGFSRPVIWDVRSGDRTDIPLSDIAGDVEAFGWSNDGQRILLSNLHQAEYQLYVYDLERSALERLDHPSGTFFSAYYVPGADDVIYANWQDATHPSQVVALDARSGQTRGTVLAAGTPPASRPWRSVTFPSSGGATIQAWLAVPEGEGPFPTILNVHGGPTAVQTETFSPAAQAWLDHGFAWMSVNYRGSTTFGRDFERAILGNLGDVEVDDMAAAVKWLVDNGVARKDAILVSGGSYGGYLTLQSMGRRPDLWAGGMGIVAIADWSLMYEDQAE
ncbi:MAG: prolyl oligopeptidase family serine peptidase, partial [Phototrophicaceae bacterium]